MNGRRNWGNAVAWVDGFSFAGCDDWRLPTSDECAGCNCTGSEMGHMWYVEPGNTADSLTNTGNFQNMLSYRWSGTEIKGDPTHARDSLVDKGYQRADHKGNPFAALARRWRPR